MKTSADYHPGREKHEKRKKMFGEIAGNFKEKEEILLKIKKLLGS